ncbi:MAG: hypothetical protein WC755_07025 [Candidatus Woesearchaeota archaeon]
MVNPIKKLWNKTVFPDIIQKRKEEKAMREELRKEILAESREEIKASLKEEIVKKEVEKLKGGGGLKAFGEKLAKGFENNTKFANQDKMDMMLGRGGNNTNGLPSAERLSDIMGGNTGQGMSSSGVRVAKDYANLMDGRTKKTTNEEILNYARIHKKKDNAVTKEERIKEMMKL